MPYNDSTAYAKYLKKKITSSGGCGCGNCDECNSSSEDCGCCPPGLVEVFDSNGKPQGCLTPNDAQIFIDATFECQEGYVKLYKEGETPLFRGCVSEDKFVELYEALNQS